ncbi:MAG: methyltransferase family protein, partial [Promethearchaeota archaeon]
LQNPGILLNDFLRLEGFITIFGFIFFLYSFIYHIKHRDKMNTRGPYKYVRHPQYLGIIITTFGMTLGSIQTVPIPLIFPSWLVSHGTIFLFWILMVLIYIVLAKIEEISMFDPYGLNFLKYKNSVPFFIPKIISGDKLEKYTLKIVNGILFFFQYLPNSTLYFGIMSIPLFVFILIILQKPEFIQFPYILSDFLNPLFIVGLSFSIYSLIYSVRRKGQLIITGLYKYIRHPQYFGIIIATFSLTLGSLFTPSVRYLFLPLFSPHQFILSLWVFMTLIYIFLARIEEKLLKKSYGKEFLKYKLSVPFFFPFLKLKLNDDLQDQILNIFNH